MSTRSKLDDRNHGAMGSAQDAAEAAYGAGKRVYDHAEERLDELSKFGSQRPLLAMGLSFVAGYFFAKIFSR